ncbi:MAG: hypothetical protein HZB79_04435 [Deltaproteobacteria bacterium]|nr:hypothetical protein [Deltaproteobacteria bacterium]
MSKDMNIYIADFGSNLIRKIGHDSYVSTYAGTGNAGYRDGDNEQAMFKGPDNIDIDAEGNIYVADADNHRIRKITTDGIATTIAGSGKSGFADGVGTKAQFAYPTGIAVDAFKNLYIADRGSNSIRKIDRNGMVTTIAGNGVPAYSDGIGKASHFNNPISVALDNASLNLFIADSGNNVIRKMNLTTTRVTTFAGSSDRIPGYRDGKGPNAIFSWPTGLAVDIFGNLYVADSNNNRIRKVNPEGVVSTIAGATVAGFKDGLGHYSQFKSPTGIYVDKLGNIYVADSGNNRIRKISRSLITTENETHISQRDTKNNENVIASPRPF